MSKEQIEEMLASYTRLEEIRTVELEQAQLNLKLHLRAIDIQEKRNKILTEILSAIKGEH